MSVFTRWAQTERGPGAQAAALALAGVVFLGALPYLLIVVGPKIDHRFHLENLEPGASSLAIGGIILISGMVFGLWSVFLQIAQGLGTPLPMLPTRRLLTTGPYRYCRNPMVLGTILAYLGLSIAAATVTGAAFVLLFGGLLVVYVKLVEEEELAERFGEDYAVYAREVPFIIPRFPKGR